jgi:peptidoglycan/xylan/chitin deacetylase (PgdA/CDA1 family)
MRVSPQLFLATFRALLPLLIALPAWASNTVSICRYPDEKKAAVSFTFDDGHPAHFTNLVPRLDRYGFKATFYVIPSKVSADLWPVIKAAAVTGHEIGNHGMTHLNLQSVTNAAALNREIIEAADLIAEKTGKSPASFAYPFCKSNPTAKALVRSRHAVDRGYYPLYEGQYPAEKANAETDQALTNGVWLVRLSHGVDGALFEEHLKYLKSREADLCVGTYGEVGRYIAERDAAQLTVTEQAANHATFTLTLPAAMKAELFSVPLTVRVGSVVTNVVPDGRPVTVRW